MSDISAGHGPDSELAPPSSAPDTPPPPRSRVEWVFLASHGGLRAGWSVLVFVGIFAALFIVTGVFFAHFVHMNVHAPLPPGVALASEAWQFALVLIATWLMSVFERRPLFYYGYQGRARALRFVSGALWGFAAISALIFTLARMGYLVLDGRGLAGEAIPRYAVLWGLVFLLTGFFEESVFRGYLQFTVTRGIGFWWGAFLLAALFGLMHRSNPGESPIGLFSAAAVGLVFCLSLWYTGSLWWAVGFHAAWDWGQSYFYGSADSGMLARGHLLREHPSGAILWSGGTTGPEGSVLIVPMLGLMALAMWLWWGRRIKSPFAGTAWKPARQDHTAPAADPKPRVLIR